MVEKEGMETKRTFLGMGGWLTSYHFRDFRKLSNNCHFPVKVGIFGEILVFDIDIC